MSTSITVEFQVNDLDANYEVVGTSDNYSFQEKIGLGSDIVFAEGDAFVKVIPLRGNYGIFDVRVFAVTEIGVRSPSVIGRIEVLPKELEGTFTFSEINTNQNLESSVIYSPTYAGDKLEIDCEFGGKSIEFNWSLIPPNGHPQEGNSLSTELLSDTFLSGFKINLFNDGQIIDLEQASYSETSLAALSSTLQTEKENVQDIFNNYRDFSLRLNEAVFNDLNLSRDISLQIISVDRFGGESTGIANATNLEPVISNLNYSTKGSDTSFSWESTDADFKDVKIEVLAIPEGTSLIQEEDLQASASYFQALKQAKPYNDFAGAYYTAGDKVVYNGKIYEAIQTHTRGNNEYPDDDFEIDEQTGEVIEGVANWALIGDAINFLYFSSNDPDDDLGSKNINEDDTLKNVEISDDLKTFSATQLWGYKYYYTFQPYDEFGEGKVYNLTKKGLIDKNADDSILEPILVNVKIDNLRFREVKDDLVFNWDATDQDGNLVDLNQYKFLFGGQDFPSLLGISGSLYDVHTNQKITGITNGFNSKSLDFDEDGDLVVNSNLPSAKVFDQYKYTRELNNSIYKTGGFPSDFGDYDASTNYVSGDNVLSDNKIYTANTQNNEQSPNVQPYYSGWSSSQTYYASSSDAFNYRNNIYKTINDFGPNSSNISGLFNEGLVYNIGDIVLSPESDVSVFSESDSYVPGDFVFYSGSIYECLQTIATEENAFPDNADFWSRLDIFNDLTCAYFQSTANSNSSYPFDVSSNWSKVNPASLAANGQFFEFLIPAYELPVSDWSSQDSYNAGNFVVYENDIWSGTQFSQNQIPSGGSNYWSNQSNSQDIGLYSTYYSRNYQSGDLVYSNNFVYKCTRDDPAGGPITAITNEGQSILSSYEQTNWLPYWELNDQYDNIVFKHVGIPQSGKRSVGIELGIVDKNGRIINQANLLADNPPPYILTEGFDVDSTGEATKVKFNFNYALGFQEKTTKVYLYRSESPDFDVVDEYGFPLTGENTPFVKSVVGAGDATFGQNITQIIDEPPIDKIDGVDQITGYYYKILPFDDFGSGVLYNVPDGSMRRVIVYPKRYNNPNPNVMPGRVLRSNPTSTTDAVPGAIQNLTGSTSFENFFLNWNAPGSNFFDNNTSTDFENDIDHYEVWQSDDPYIKSGQNKNATSPWLEVENTGYRKIKGVAYSVSEGDTTPEESLDPARYIYGAENIFNVAANTPSVEVVHGGKTNDTKYFWVRAVDFAGNKSPFSSAANEVNVKGLGLNLGRASATDIAGFEINMTDTFNDAIASVPNNPFSQDGNGGLEWDEHVLFSEGTGYIVEGGGFGSDVGYIWWDKKDENGSLNLSENYYVKTVNGVELYTNQSIDSLIEFEGTDLTSIYFSGVNYSGSNRHPAGSNNQTDKVADFDDGDFIIARNSDGVPTVVHHAFANALIGTANIAEASIINAKINDLSADKITAGQIKGHKIEITHSGGNNSDQYGSIASVGFDGIDYNNPRSGFVLSGDGTFAFQQGAGALTFEDDKLILYGGFRSTRELDFDFVDIDLSPQFFTYHELQDGTFEPADDCPDTINIRTTFRNSRIESSGVRFKMEAVSGNQRYDVFSYDDHDANGNYDNISGFTYDGDFSEGIEQKTARATFDLTGFSGILEYYDQIADSVVITAKSNKSELERSTTITRVIDGRVGDDGQNGTSVNIIFKRDSSKPSTPSASAGVPESEGWADSDPGGAGLLWASNGITPVGGGNYTWGDVFQVEGQAVAEVYIYRKNNSSGNTGGSYNFTSNNLTAPTNWLKNPPDLTSNDDKVYVSVGLATGSATDSTTSINWGAPAIYAQRTDGQNGASVNIIFKRDSSKPSTPSASAGVPESEGWADSDPGGAGLLWASNGITPVGGGNYTWGDVFQVEGQAVAEVYIYRKNNSSGNTGGSYNFTSNNLTAPTNWLKNPPDLTSNDDKVYVSVGLATGSATDSTTSINWGAPAIYAQRTDGTPGKNASTPTFRGIWNDQTDYTFIQGSTTEADRGDIVQFTGYGSILPDPDNKYYIAKSSSGPGNIQPPHDNGLNSTYWLKFGDEFENVATDLLLTKEAIITEKLTMGVGGSATEVPHSGIIVSADFTGGLLNVFPPENEPYQIIDNTNYFEDYDTPGFLLARTDDGVVFDVGGTGIIGQTGYIRFNSKSGKLEIAGSFINNTVIDENIIYNGVFELGQTDELTSFVGGGYNNKLLQESNIEFQNIGSAIIGGAWNEMQGRFSTIAGGYSGTCKDNFSFIGGGWGNNMPLDYIEDSQGANFIGNGILNQISGGAGQTILNGGSNKMFGFTGSYEPVFDFNNDLYSPYILGTGDSALTEIGAGWEAKSWIGVFYSAGGGSLRGLSEGGWVYNTNFTWMYIPATPGFAYIDEPINGIWTYMTTLGTVNTSYNSGWYWLYRPDEQNISEFDISDSSTNGLLAYSNYTQGWVFFDRESNANQLRLYDYSFNGWVNLN